MRKGSGTKTHISVTLESKLVEKLKKKLAKRMIKVSNYIEHLIDEDLKK
jgi:predicted DNA binding CopG/RHH family protein